MSFTPGPWAVDKVEDSSYGDDDVVGFWIRGKGKDQCIGGMVVASVVSDCLRHEVDFNARLIAAAPELLEALEAAVAFIDSHAADPDLTDEMCQTYSRFLESNAKVVIAKARGEGV